MKPTIYAIALVLAVVSLMWLEAANRRSAAPPEGPVSPVLFEKGMLNKMSAETDVDELKAEFGDPYLVTGGVSPITKNAAYSYNWMDRRGTILAITEHNRRIIEGYVMPSREAAVSRRFE